MKAIISLVLAFVLMAGLVCAGANITGQVLIDQNDDADAINIDSEATSAGSYWIEINMGQGGRPAIFHSNVAGTDYYTKMQTGQSQGGSWFFRDLASADTAGPVCFIEQDNTGDDQPALKIQQDATASGADGIQITVPTATSARGLHMQNVANTMRVSLARPITDGTGLLYIYRDVVSGTTAGPMVQITQENSGDDQNVLNIRQDGNGNGLFIDQNGNSYALNIDNTGTSAGLFVNQQGVEKGAHFYSNVNADATGELVFIEADNAAFDKPALKIQQDGTGYIIEAGNFDVDADGDVFVNQFIRHISDSDSYQQFTDTTATHAWCHGRDNSQNDYTISYQAANTCALGTGDVLNITTTGNAEFLGEVTSNAGKFILNKTGNACIYYNATDQTIVIANDVPGVTC